MKNIKAIILDYDGGVAESNKVKTEAFREFFKNKNPKYLSEIIGYHKKHEGISRREKIRYYYEHLLGEPISKERIDNLSDEFSEIVLEKLINTSKLKYIALINKDKTKKN